MSHLEFWMVVITLTFLRDQYIPKWNAFNISTLPHTRHSDVQLLDRNLPICWNFPACSEKIFFSLHLFFRDLLSIDNVGIIVICGTDLIMGQYTNIRYLAQLSAMEEYSLWVGERKPDVNLQMRRSPSEIGRRAKHGVSPVLMPTCPLRPWINQLEPVIFRPDSQNYVREKKTRHSASEREGDFVNINTLVTW